MTDEERLTRLEANVEALAKRWDYQDQRDQTLSDGLGRRIERGVTEWNLMVKADESRVTSAIKTFEAVIHAQRCIIEKQVRESSVEERCQALRDYFEVTYHNLESEYDGLFEAFEKQTTDYKRVLKEFKRLEHMQGAYSEQINRLEHQLTSHSHVRLAWRRVRQWWHMARRYPWHSQQASQ
jgi:chromosome segregation ATPase